MNQSLHITRRKFLHDTGKISAMLAVTAQAPAILAASSPNSTLGVGCIGLGTRGGDLLEFVARAKETKVVAVSDVYRPHVQKGLRGSNNPETKSYQDYRELLADKNVDAVVIAAPDHWHCQMVLDAVAAGKDIYCEKGFARTLPEAKKMRDALKRSKVVFQLGHQGRQSAAALQAKNLIAAGVLGPITFVRTGRFMSSAPSHPMWRWYGYYSRWERPDPAQVQKDVNWEQWLGPAPRIPWNERHFWHWRCYWPYGTGQAGDLLSHEMDFVQYVLGHGIPDSCHCTGMNSLLKDDRDIPDTWVATYLWEKLGRTVTFTGSMNTNVGQPVEICGKLASMEFNGIAQDVNHFTIRREGYDKRKDVPEEYQPGKTPPQPNHMQDFLNCVRSRSTPKCPVDEAFIESATYLMSVESYKRGRTVRWDAEREEIV